MLDFLTRHQVEIMLALSSVCGMTAFFVLITDSLPKDRKVALMIIELGGMTLLLSDMFSYVYSGDTSTVGWWMVRICNYLTFAMMPFLMGGFTHYVSNLLVNEGGMEHAPLRLKAVYILATISIALITANLFGGFYYFIDSNNKYHRSWAFLLCYIFPLIIVIILLSVIIQYRKRINHRICISLMMFVITPILGSIVQFFLYGISITDIFITGMCIALYIFVLLDMNEAKKIKDEIERKNREQMEIISTIANVYNSMYELDLEHNTFRELQSGYASVSSLNDVQQMDLQQVVNTMLRKTIDPSCFDDSLIRDTDLSTIDERLKDTDIWTREVMNLAKEWKRGRMIVSKRDENGKILRILWVTEDIDKERKERERLIDASERAIAASEAKSSFLSNMSHEIRTPINAVLGMNEMILRESSEDNVIEYSENIRTAGNTLLGLVNDILDFSKIEAGKMEIIPVDYDISSLINDLVNMIQTKADAKGLLLKLDIAEDIPKMLHGDEVRIKQVITNILTNAVKYTEKGSVTFEIKHERIEDDPEGVYLDFAVRDTGIGIKPEDMKKLFSEFERIEEERNRNVEGTGLGMNITKRLLEMMGTSLQVDSVYGEGSNFHFRLKQRVVKWDPLGDYEAAYRASLTDRKKYTEKFTAPDAIVLVVDDTLMNLTVFKSLLKRTKVQIETAVSGAECLSMTKEKKYDIIFLDHMMPEMDGIETLHNLKADADNLNLDTVEVCLTANAISGAREQYISEGFDDYLTKPIESDKLEEMLIQYLPAEKVVKTQDGADTDATCDEDEESLPEWLQNCEGIDSNEGVKNSGGTDGYMTVLNGFYVSINEKADEIEGYYKSDDYENYTVKVHALKSSARIIGASDLSEKARLLEMAGKEGNTDYIRNNTDEMLSLYRSYRDILSPIDAVSDDLPEIPQDTLEEAYAAISEFASAMDYDCIRMVLESVKDYKLLPEDKAKFDIIQAKLYQMDWDGIRDTLK